MCLKGIVSNSADCGIIIFWPNVKSFIKTQYGLYKHEQHLINLSNSIKQIINKLKMRLVKYYVDSILLYDAELWTLNKLMKDKINVFEMWVYRWIGQIS
jgi:hypothetical protein